MAILHHMLLDFRGALKRPATLCCVLMLLFALPSCMTYQRVNRELQMKLIQGQYKEADALVASSKRMKKSRNKLLYLLNRGYFNMMIGKHEESIRFFMQADNIIKAERKNYLNEALAMFINPSVRTYHAEDFEEVMVHYFQMMNFLSQGNRESALVEVRRMNMVLNEMNDKFGKSNKYNSDAFGHLMMGLIYEADRDFNNAFIAYRNAYNVYEESYKELFGLEAPLQLKKDLIRTAQLSGFRNEVEHYEKLFGMEYEKREHTREVVLFWNNGLSPIKDQWSVDFTIVQYVPGTVLFLNNQFGFSFPFPVEHLSEKARQDLLSLQIIRIAFPRYLSRPSVFDRSKVEVNGQTIRPERAQNIESIAHRSLQDRFAREMGNALLRFALKKSAEVALRRENREAGMILGLANVFTEQADIRNWQTLPAHIHYARIPLNEGQNELRISMKDVHGVIGKTETINLDGRTGMQFRQVFSLQSFAPGTIIW